MRFVLLLANKNHTYVLDGESFSGYGGRFTFRSNTEKGGGNMNLKLIHLTLEQIWFLQTKIIGKNTQ
jgi:hypothetical protein